MEPVVMSVATVAQPSLSPGKFRTNQPSSAASAERGLDCYATPQIAVTALLEGAATFFARPGLKVWEPCAGDGAIVRVLRERGLPVIASDLKPDSALPLHFANDLPRRRRAKDAD
jgi:hypothetical protein